MERPKEQWSPISFPNGGPILPAGEQTSPKNCPAAEPPSPLPTAPPQPPEAPPQVPGSEGDYIPSFCLAGLEAISPSSSPPAEPLSPLLSPPMALVPSTPVLPAAFQQMFGKKTSEPCQQNKMEKLATSRPKAYDVARTLMATVPMRIVDNGIYVYDGSIYRFFGVSEMNRLIMHYCRPYVQMIGDAGFIERIYKVIQADPDIVYCPPPQGEPFVATDDGLLDLSTHQLLAPTPQLFVTVKLNGNYTMGAQSACPTFDRFLLNCSGNDPVLIERIWQAIGYSLVPDNNAKCFILLQGVPDSGKSLLCSIISALLDSDLVTSLDIGSFGERFGPSELVGKQLCLCPDMPSGPLDPKTVSLIKNITGGDIITVDVKYQPRIKIRCHPTLILATNHCLTTRNPDPALFRRAVTIPFNYSVEKSKQAHNLKEIIWSERNAIVYKALQAYFRLRANNYQFAGDYAVNSVMASSQFLPCSPSDYLFGFCQKRCVASPGNFITTEDLYNAYVNFSNTGWPGGIAKFSNEFLDAINLIYPNTVIRDRRRSASTGSNPVRGFLGIALQETSQTEGGFIK